MRDKLLAQMPREYEENLIDIRITAKVNKVLGSNYKISEVASMDYYTLLAILLEG